MYLFVDETECQEYFIVAGLLVKSKVDAGLAFKHFKKDLKSIPIPAELKAKLFTEFKATEMDRTYQKIKIKMFRCLNNFDYYVIYSCAKKKSIPFSQDDKENAYISMLSIIVSVIESEVCILFDRFKKPDFESKIVGTLLRFEKVKSIQPVDSQSEVGIQFVDNIASAIRLHKTGKDVNGFFRLIESHVKEV